MVLLMAMVAITSVSVLPVAVEAADEVACAQWGSRGPIIISQSDVEQYEFLAQVMSIEK